MGSLPAIFALVSVLGSHPQQLVFSGTWEVSYASGVRVENDVSTPIVTSGLLVIEQTGDSLVGALHPAPKPGQPAQVPSRLISRSGSPPGVFVSTGIAKVQTGHGKGEVTVISTWRLRVVADSLVGTVERVYEGLDLPSQEPQAVSGHRRR